MTPAADSLPFMPAWLDDSDLDVYERAVYLRVCRRADGKTGLCTEAAQSMADGLKMSTKTLGRVLRKLADKGYLDGYKGQGSRSPLRPLIPQTSEPRSEVKPSTSEQDSEVAPSTSEPSSEVTSEPGSEVAEDIGTTFGGENEHRNVSPATSERGSYKGSPSKERGDSDPNGSGAGAPAKPDLLKDPLAPEPPGEEGKPFERAAWTMRFAYESLGWDPVKRDDVTPALKEGSSLQNLICSFGERRAAEMFMWAHRNWAGGARPTWGSVYRQRNQIREGMSGREFGDKPDRAKSPKTAKPGFLSGMKNNPFVEGGDGAKG